MKTRAAVLRDVGKDFEIVELDLDEPKTGEVLVRFVASGLCHSDDHLRTGDIPVRYPIVGGHEGAGIVEQVGPGVTRLSPSATTWSPRGCRSAGTAGSARAARPTCATWAGSWWTTPCPTARTATTRDRRTSGRCACSARSRSTR